MKQKDSNSKWIIEAFIITFILSGIISYISSNGVSKLNIGFAVIILIFVVFLGILFDIIGVAVTVANEEHFHAKATKKAEGAQSSSNKKCIKSCKYMCRCNRRYLWSNKWSYRNNDSFKIS